MKKWIIGSLILVALMVVAAGVYGQASDKEKKHQAKHECTFVDQNNDGKCDKCGSTADKCKNEAKQTEAKDCSKCPMASSCGEKKEVVTTTAESTEATPPCCEKKK